MVLIWILLKVAKLSSAGQLYALIPKLNKISKDIEDKAPFKIKKKI